MCVRLAVRGAGACAGWPECAQPCVRALPAGGHILSCVLESRGEVSVRRCVRAVRVCASLLHARLTCACVCVVPQAWRRAVEGTLVRIPRHLEHLGGGKAVSAAPRLSRSCTT